MKDFFKALVVTLGLFLGFAGLAFIACIFPILIKIAFGIHDERRKIFFRES